MGSPCYIIGTKQNATRDAEKFAEESNLSVNHRAWHHWAALPNFRLPPPPQKLVQMSKQIRIKNETNQELKLNAAFVVYTGLIYLSAAINNSRYMLIAFAVCGGFALPYVLLPIYICTPCWTVLF